ncbi:hypothetical protein [Streptomyces sp. 2A115]|uniref:hypothetical protein n=1 Tax=Streptomyces sp. 2A115 TaxID=3457439 RepID=UPI003FCF6719
MPTFNGITPRRQGGAGDLRATAGRGGGASDVLLGIQRCEGVADALFEEFVGELLVGQGAAVSSTR